MATKMEINEAVNNLKNTYLKNITAENVSEEKLEEVLNLSTEIKNKTLNLLTANAHLLKGNDNPEEDDYQYVDMDGHARYIVSYIKHAQKYLSTGEKNKLLYCIDGAINSCKILHGYTNHA